MIADTLPSFCDEVHGNDFMGFRQLDVDPTVVPIHHELFPHIPINNLKPLHDKKVKPPQEYFQYPLYRKHNDNILNPVLNAVYEETGLEAEDDFRYTETEDETVLSQVSTGSDPYSPSPLLFPLLN